MDIDYKQLRELVKEAMFTGGGINEPSAPEGVPHRMPASDTETPEQDRGDEKANKLYEKALKAREATEQLVEALDEPIYDDAYEQAYKATMCLRKVLNSIGETGAHPMPTQRVVAPPANQQRFNSGGEWERWITMLWVLATLAAWRNKWKPEMQKSMRPSDVTKC